MEDDIRKARKWGVLLDTSILSTYIAGIYESNTRHKVLEKIESEEDIYPILSATLPTFKTYITPHVLAETQGILTKELGKDTAKKIICFATKYIIQMKEHQIGNKPILLHEKMEEFGVIDIALHLTSRIHGRYLITKDHDLATLTKGRVLPIESLRAYYLQYFCS